MQQNEVFSGGCRRARLFRRSVAISSDTVVVGADSGNVGSNPHQGSAYVFAVNGAPPSPTPATTPTPTATPGMVLRRRLQPLPPSLPQLQPQHLPARPRLQPVLLRHRPLTPTPTATPSASPSPTATPGTLGNISTRLRVLSGDNALIGGMIATGTAGKRVIIRAIGPSLIPFGVPGALANPTLDLFQGSTLLFSNDDWHNSTQQAEITNSGLAPSNALESAIIWTLNPGQNYTAVVRGHKRHDGRGNSGSVRSGSGRGVEAGEHQHARVCGRGRQRDDRRIDRGTGQWNEPQDPGASARTDAERLWGAGALANPTLDLVNSSGTVIRSNNDWRDDPAQRALIEAAGLAPSHAVEAALVETVAPGAYTAIVRGSNRTPASGWWKLTIFRSDWYRRA